MTTPLRSSTSGTPGAGSAACRDGSGWSRWSGCTESTRISFRAPMWARLNRSTNSVAVRRGSTRNAEYP